MRDLVVHALTSLDGFSADEGTGAMQRMGEIDDPAGDELLAGRLAGAGHAHHGAGHLPGDGRILTEELAHQRGADERHPKVVFSGTLRDAPGRKRGSPAVTPRWRSAG